MDFRLVWRWSRVAPEIGGSKALSVVLVRLLAFISVAGNRPCWWILNYYYLILLCWMLLAWEGIREDTLEHRH